MIHLGIAAGIFWLEYFIKNYVEKHVPEDSNKPICNGCFLLRKHHNKGAFLNAGEKVRPIVAAISLLMTCVLSAIFVVTLGQKGKGTLMAGLTLLLGGAYSNTYDRLKRKYVVDYFSFNVRWKKLRAVVFNIADFCIMIGAVLAVCGKSSTGC